MFYKFLRRISPKIQEHTHTHTHTVSPLCPRFIEILGRERSKERKKRARRRKEAVSKRLTRYADQSFARFQPRAGQRENMPRANLYSANPSTINRWEWKLFRQVGSRVTNAPGRSFISADRLGRRGWWNNIPWIRECNNWRAENDLQTCLQGEIICYIRRLEQITNA